jgi:hypothetical protein
MRLRLRLRLALYPSSRTADCGRGEALALRWADIGTKTITVDRAISDGVEKGTKPGSQSCLTRQ